MDVCLDTTLELRDQQTTGGAGPSAGGTSRRTAPASAASATKPGSRPSSCCCNLRTSATLSRDRDPREAGQTVGQRRFLELDLWKAPRQEVVVGLHVEVPVSAEVE